MVVTGPLYALEQDGASDSRSIVSAARNRQAAPEHGPMHPWSSDQMSRYEEKLFLRPLEAYVLESIGELGAVQADIAAAMESKLQRTYSISGSWTDIVKQQMGLPPDLAEKIRSMWNNGKKKAAEQELHPGLYEFTRQFVDTNFAS